jgi:hypothetical protein
MKITAERNLIKEPARANHDLPRANEILKSRESSDWPRKLT